MKKRDMVLIILLLVFSAAGMVAFSGRTAKGADAYIYVGGQLYGKYDLSVDNEIHIAGENGIINDIAISDNSIYMKNATCPGRQCVACGHISRNNESICCAPAGLLIVVLSEDESEYDAVTK